jgi:hypothetical protein
VRVTPDSLAALRDKYREIKRLRDEHEAGIVHDPKRELAQLARRFPGALRELDELPMDEVHARLAALDGALGNGEAPAWAALQIGYHGTYRAALRIKRLASPTRRERDVAAVHALLAQHYVPAPDEPPLAALDREAIEGILYPPEGRLHAWVLRWVAAELGVSPQAVAAALFVRERTRIDP